MTIHVFFLHQTPSSAPRACYKYPPAAVYPLIQPKLLPKHLHQLKKRIGTNLSVKYVAARWPLYWYFSSPLPAPGGWAWSWHTIRLLQKANQSAELIPLKNTGEKGINNQGGARGCGNFHNFIFSPSLPRPPTWAEICPLQWRLPVVQPWGMFARPSPRFA